jgi:transposase-like protein
MVRPDKATLLSLYTRDGLTDSQIARQFHVSRQTVWRWRKHYGIELVTQQVYKVRVQKGDS